jgi:hypothetical protein
MGNVFAVAVWNEYIKTENMEYVCYLCTQKLGYQQKIVYFFFPYNWSEIYVVDNVSCWISDIYIKLQTRFYPNP